MAKKTPSKSGRPWKPGDPLKLDQAIQRASPDPHIAERLARAEDALVSHINNANRSVTPTNHKPFNRQKKG